MATVPSTATPTDAVSADLFWWREQPELHTLVSIYGAHPTGDDCSLHLTFVLFDATGAKLAGWEHELWYGGAVFIDSKNPPPALARSAQPREGLLAVFLSARGTGRSEFLRRYNGRLYSMTDWYSAEAGELCAMHNDQSAQYQATTAAAPPIEFTEIVVRETAAEKNYLIILNGGRRQAERSLRLSVNCSASGKASTAVYGPAIEPYSVLKLPLAEMFPQLADFCAGRFVSLQGEYLATGVFIRPYVITEGERLCGYHGGNRYRWQPLPDVIYRFLGGGETNPVFAVHDSHATTVINLLHSHGDLEDDFWVDARLYDRHGRLASERKRWLLAKRHGLSRGAIKDLLPDAGRSFYGHLALSFSYDQGATNYPRRLQALTEYITAHGASRVMLWSDEWNSAKRQLLAKKRPRWNRAFYRVWCRPPLVSSLAISNSGIACDYAETADCKIQLINHRGHTLAWQGSIPPQGTLFKRISELFPDLERFLGGQSTAMVVVDSAADLAAIQMTTHETSGVISCEHLLAAQTRSGDLYHWPAGS